MKKRRPRIPLRENRYDGNMPRHVIGDEDFEKGIETVEYWKKECRLTKKALFEAKSESDAFLQCYSEMEDLLQKAEVENGELNIRIQSLEHQLEGSKRSSDKWKAEFERLLNERKAERDARQPVEHNDVAIQVWDTEFEVSSLLSSVNNSLLDISSKWIRFK